MSKAEYNDFIADEDDLILVTGGSGFIGSRLVQCLVERGFRKLRCFARPTSDVSGIEAVSNQSGSARIEIVKGNLLSGEDCIAAMKDVSVVFHLATGGGKSYPDSFMNTVVTTRNLLEGARHHQCLRRFVNVSSFAVYTNMRKPRRRLLNEASPIEERPELRGDAYCFAKVKQDEIVSEYGKKFGIPYVVVRPGSVFGPGKPGIPARVGIDTFGIFLHLGGSNTIPFTYVDNCAEAIALAGLKTGIEGRVFNVVDDDLPSSRAFLRLYKKNVKPFRSFYVPHPVSYLLCYLWERYSDWSHGQLDPVFNRRRWHAMWKKTQYSNEELKISVGWKPKVSMREGLTRYLEACQNGGFHA